MDTGTKKGIQAVGNVVLGTYHGMEGILTEPKKKMGALSIVMQSCRRFLWLHTNTRRLCVVKFDDTCL